MIDPQDWLGKVWVGDCLELMKAMPDGCVDAVVTDPPYGAGGRDGATHTDRGQDMAGNRMHRDSFIWFARTWGRELYRLTSAEAHFYCFSGWRRYLDLQIAFEVAGWELRSLIVWDKGNGMGEFWRSSHEFILFLTKATPRRLTHGACFNVVRFPNPPKEWHPAEKPTDLMAHLITASTHEGEVVLDPFLGSGTTAVACERLGRKWLGCEINPEYAAIAEARIAREREQLALPGMREDPQPNHGPRQSALDISATDGPMPEREGRRCSYDR